MTTYYRAPNLKFHEESWGGIVKLPDRRIVFIEGKDAFKRLLDFSPLDITSDADMPNELKKFIDWGLVTRSA